ncbi:MAG: response regulator transcription factor [Pseudomonadota bacterium]
MADIAQAVSLFSADIPDVVILDVPTGDADLMHLRRLSKLMRQRPALAGVPLIAVVGDCDDGRIVAAFSCGASGVIKRSDPAALVAMALAQVAHGGVALSPDIATRMIDHFQRTGPMMGSAANLTARETDVLRLIGQGLRVADAAKALGLAPSTVACHIKSIYRKLGINCRAEAAFQAARLGLLS